MLRTIKRLLLRLELMHAQHQAAHWQSSGDGNNHGWRRYWRIRINNLRSQLDDDECEQLSKRAIAPLHWRK